MMSVWRSLPVKPQELCLELMLVCGQSFRWKKISEDVWRSVLYGKIWTLKQTNDSILYIVFDPCCTAYGEQPGKDVGVKDKFLGSSSVSRRKGKDLKSVKQMKLFSEKSTPVEVHEDVDVNCKYTAILFNYFQLDVSLETLYSKWNKVDLNFKSKAADFSGIRMLRQDPIENLFSFICSSNNNISRISQMVNNLCIHYGDEIGELDGVTYHTFPSITQLARPGVETKLRGLGFGYRARYIAETARFLKEQETGWLEGLRQRPYLEARVELRKLCGVGAKVADCVCLMSLDKHEAVPVDTHVWQIAARDYLPELATNKNLSATLYMKIVEYFQELWGPYAGWAHSVLFSADLKKFQDRNTKHPGTKKIDKRKVKPANLDSKPKKKIKIK